MTSFPAFFAQPLVAHLGWTLLHFLWQGALISALYAVVRHLGGRWMSSHARYTLACLSLASMALAPILTYGFLSSNGWPRAVPAAAIPQSQLSSLENIVSVAPWYSHGLDTLERALPWLVMAWFLGVIVLLIRLLRGTLVTAHLRSMGTRLAPHPLNEAFQRIAAQIGVVRPVHLVISSVMDVPVVIGWLRPMVLVPAAALTGMAPEHIEALLAHELGHIRRHDYLLNVIQRVVEAVLFYHPAVWWVSNEIRRERELCCDDLAVAASGDAMSYAHALAELELSRAAHADPMLAANGGSLVARIRRLAEPSQPVSHTVAGPVAALAVGLIVLSVGGATIVRGSQAPAGAQGTIERDSIWVDTVKRGDMPLAVRGRGTIITNGIADLRVPLPLLKEVKAGQMVSLSFSNRGGRTIGRVTGTSSVGEEGAVTVQIMNGLPPNVQPGIQVDGTIEVGRLPNVLWVGRPVDCRPNNRCSLFKLEQNGDLAVRAEVEFGRGFASAIEIRSGLAPGDKVILSDMAQYMRYHQLTLK